MLNTTNSKWKTIFKGTVIILLILVSLGLIFNEQIEDQLVSTYRPIITAKTIQQNKRKHANYDFDNVKALDLQSVAKSRLNAERIPVIGSILVPKVKVHLPIAKGTSNTTLALTAGTLRADQKMGKGNYPLAGHNMMKKDVLFSPLYFKSKVGDKVYLTDMKQIYTYKITIRKFIKATDTSVIKQTQKPMITLITCDSTGNNRLMLRGILIGHESFNQANNKLQKQFSNKFNSQL
ncbi:class A sortase [Lentilactobacillus sp. SPB1-3]|uniref:Class A sortase n=1 Tax=Lentilactobacillus terminaliae TaxID=3003483 RepID=A0ACD5DE41_9LACO|nr:class A sortase [Lentilactobacillus sp. SPB1-3]MCZ0977682.1 class A sortase [Lentilactobacillus sp. SPB1-3]